MPQSRRRLGAEIRVECHGGNQNFHKIIVHRQRFIPTSRHTIDNVRKVLGCLDRPDTHIERLEQLLCLLAQLQVGAGLIFP